jgi:DNA repair exonuclease SbcCD ATPase subunit
VIPKVQSLGAAARLFIHERLEATAGILNNAAAEARLLDRLSELTRGQRSIARETQTLGVLTNIEVARLGQMGAGFEYLAHELDEFSQSVTKGTRELAGRTDERRAAIVETRRMLAAGLPRIRREFARIEADLEKALLSIDSSQTELAMAPARFRACAEEIASQIAGVVAAVQSHDITRQQLEHVQQSLELIRAQVRGVEEHQHPGPDEPPSIRAGQAIQIYQLRSIRETVGCWITQIGTCMESILRISSSDVVRIGPAVVEQEKKISSQLARIGQLEQECMADSKEVQSALAGLSNLMELVGEHLARSRSVRDRLQLLTFNSIIEASRLGAQADAILEISKSIKRISSSWSEMTDGSAQAMEEILGLVEKSKAEMKSFSQEGSDGLREAQSLTRGGLEHLRAAAGFAAAQATEIEASTRNLQSRSALVGAAAGRLGACFNRLGEVLDEIEGASCRWETDHPVTVGPGDPNEMEEMFSVYYTTEMERAVLRAALCGGPIPVADQRQAGNDVELF